MVKRQHPTVVISMISEDITSINCQRHRAIFEIPWIPRGMLSLTLSAFFVTLTWTRTSLSARPVASPRWDLVTFHKMIRFHHTRQPVMECWIPESRTSVQQTMPVLATDRESIRLKETGSTDFRAYLSGREKFFPFLSSAEPPSLPNSLRIIICFVFLRISTRSSSA